MALTTNVTKSIELPHEPGQHVVIRMLSWRQLESARTARTMEAMESVKDMDQEFLQGMLKNLPDTPKEDEEATTRTPYNKRAMLRAGIVSWSYTEEVSEATIDDLDEPTADFLFSAIEKLSAVSVDEGKDSGTS